MIIWSGAGGLLSGLLIFVCLMATQVGLNAAMANDRFYQDRGWPKLVGCALAAALTFVSGRVMNRVTEKTLLDPETGETVVVPSGGGHSLFFVPVEWLWIPLLIFGVIFAVK